MSTARIRPTFHIAGILAAISPAYPQFAPPPSSPATVFVGRGPSSIAVGNLNSGSSLPGLAVANRTDNTVSILPGNGMGGFGTPTAFPVGASPSSIVMADFDKDGNQDLAVANAGDNTVTVLLGDGNGGIKSTLGPFPVGKSPLSIATQDFNGDSNPDLAVVNHDGNDVTILLGDGKGHFNPASYSPVPVGNFPTSVAVADFTLDGLYDLAVTNELDNTVTILLGNAGGGFSPAPAGPFATGAYPYFVATADFNADGIPDLAIANELAGNVTVLLGNGSGGFTPAPGEPFTVGADPDALAVADFNGDGIQDLAAANSGSNTVTVLLGTGTGAFKSAGAALAVGSEPSAIGAGDFNSDGKLDLAVANAGAADVSVFLNGFSITPVMVSSASFSSTASVAPGSLVSVFGDYTILPQNAAPATSWPDYCLASTGITMTDLSGFKTSLPLLFAGPGQINAVLPPNVAAGAASFAISTSSASDCSVAPAAGPQKGTVTVAATAPSLFTANGTGKGVAAAEFLPSVISTSLEYVFNSPCSPPVAPCVPAPLDVSSGTAALVLYGTGIRNRSSLSAVTVNVNSVALTPFYADAVPGPDGADYGEDQINVSLPSSLAGSGTVYVTVSIGGATSNQATLCFTTAGNVVPLCSAPGN